MLRDRTGTLLVPGNGGRDCPGNGSGRDESGNRIECCCEACDWALCCEDSHEPAACLRCDERDCPRNGKMK